MPKRNKKKAEPSQLIKNYLMEMEATDKMIDGQLKDTMMKTVMDKIEKQELLERKS